MELTPLALFDVGGNEIVLILLIVLLLFGGEKMPELARGIGKAMREFKKAASGVEHEIKKAMEEPPAKKTAVLPKQELPPTSLPPHPPFTTPAHDLHEGLEPNKPAGGVTPTETPEPPKNA